MLTVGFDPTTEVAVGIGGLQDAYHAISGNGLRPTLCLFFLFLWFMPAGLEVLMGCRVWMGRNGLDYLF
jgi:hypothetical protein